MKMLGVSRRDALLWASAAALAKAQHQRPSVKATRTLKFFSTDDAADVEALAELIIPSDETPGAREAGVIYLIDAALATFDSDKQGVYQQGLKDVRQKVTQLATGATKVRDLAPEMQHKLMEQIVPSGFFECLRAHTLMGLFCNEEWGGNREQIGWKLIGFEDKFVYQPPFGYYDAEVNQAKPKG